MPAIEFLALDVLEARIDELRGRVLIAHHFATWCEGCVDELPQITALHASTADDPDVAWLGITWELFLAEAPHAEVAGRLAAFADTHAIGFPIVVYTGEPETLIQALGITNGTIPHTAVYGRQGETVARFGMLESPADADRLRTAVETARARP